MLRRDRHKVYAADLQQHEVDDGDVVFSPTAISQHEVPGRGSYDAPHMTSKEGCSDQDVHAFRQGSSVDAGMPNQSNDSGRDATNTGGIGPGAEPPVAIAFHAFAHEEPWTDAVYGGSKSTIEQGTETSALDESSSDRERMRGLAVERGDETRRDEKRLFGGKQDIAAWQPASTRTSNEGEADTLPDSFHLSDEYGPEGASTGRNHHDDDDNDGSMNGRSEPLLIGKPTEAGCGMIRGGTKPSSGRYFIQNNNDGDASSAFQGRQEEKGTGTFGKLSDGSDCWSSSSGTLRHQPRRLPQPRLSSRRARQNSRRAPLPTTKRYSRIAPSEDLASPTDLGTEGVRRYRRTSCRSSTKHRSPPRRHPRVREDGSYNRRGRRAVSGHRNREIRREALTETESVSGEPNDELEEEVAKLRRENQQLKQRQEGTTRLSDQGFDIEPWENGENIDGCFAMRDSSRRATRRRDDTFDIEGRSQRLPREEYAHVRQQELQHEHRRRSHSIARASYLSGVETSTGRSSTRRRQVVPTWTEFVSKTNSSLGAKSPMGLVGPHSWASRSSENAGPSFDLSLPRVLVEGGYLWKIPCHNAGTPKLRWFQIKPAEGLLTTASGHLVVRPTSAGGVGAGGSAAGRRKIGSAVSRRSEDGEESAGSVPMMRLRAAWPLALIWVDPERDLKKSPPREMGIEEVMDLARGHKTPAFWQQAAHRGIHTLPDPKLCFSLVGSQRTLDLAAEDLLEARKWVLALARVALMVDRGGLAAANGYAAVSSPRSQVKPATTPLFSDSEELSRDASPGDSDGGGDKITHAALQRRPSRKVGKPLRRKQESCIRSEEKIAQEKAGVLGGGRASSVDATRTWRQRIFPAVTRGDVAGVLTMFDQGCPIDLVHEETGDTPMLLACRLGDMGMVTECLRRGARNDPHPNFGQTALQAAVAAGREACARLILETAAPSRSDVVVSNHKDPYKDTPLHVACRRGYCGIVEVLLHHGGDLRAADRKGNTPLHGAAGCGHAAVLASLLDAGGDAIMEEKNSRGERAMHAAAASGHIACVELLLGTAAEPDIPRTDGQTPFSLASRGGHLAVTRLIRRYAPAAGTPSGGDAQFQTHQRAATGRRSPTADALPRPHASGPASAFVGIPSPKAHRNRDLEHRFYSAAGVEHRKPSSSETALTHTGSGRTGCARTTSAPNSSAPLPHGSLFDGLQVYVVGGRQPLGSQHSSAAAKLGIVSKPSPHAPTSARTMVLEGRCLSASFQQQQQQQQREHELEQQRHVDPPIQEAFQMQSSSTPSFSTGITSESNWRDNILSAPSTLAPSPPLRSFDNDGSMAKIPATTAVAATLDAGVNIARAPLSARALARMIYFSNENHAAFLTGGKIATGKVQSPKRDALTSTASIVGGLAGPAGSSVSASCTGRGGERGAHVEPLGSWMTPGIPDEQKLKTSTQTRDFEDERNNGVTENPSSSYTTAVNATMRDGFGTSTITADGASKIPATVREVNASQEDERQAEVCFVVEIPEEKDDGQAGTGASAALSGLWRVFHSEGYPYFLHEATGHSQWEDPRERRGRVFPRSSLLPEEASVPPDAGEYCSLESHSEEPEVDDEEISEEEATRFSEKTANEEETDGQQCLPPAEYPIKPILPRKVPVAVTVSHFFDVDDASRSAAIAARDLEECDQAGVEATDLPEAPTSPVYMDNVACDGTRRGNGKVDGVDNRDFARNVCRTNFEGDAGSRGDSRASDFYADGAKASAEVDRRHKNKSCNKISDDSKTHGNCHQDLMDSIVAVDSHVPITEEAATGRNTDKSVEPEIKRRQEVEESSDSSWSSLPADGRLPADGAGSADGVRTTDVGSPRSRPELSQSVLDGIGENVRNGTGVQDGEGGHEEEEEWWQELDNETRGEANRESGPSSCWTEGTST